MPFEIVGGRRVDPEVCAERALEDRALESLQVIRSTLSRAGSFSAFSGWGTFALGFLGLMASFGGYRYPEQWLVIWLTVGVLGFVVGSVTLVVKAKRESQSLTIGAGRRFCLTFMPPLIAGGVLTLSNLASDSGSALPGVWLLLYGVALVNAGASSTRWVVAMGWAFMGLSAIAFVAPSEWGNLLLGVGFGGLHLLFGFAIERHGSDAPGVELGGPVE